MCTTYDIHMCTTYDIRHQNADIISEWKSFPAANNDSVCGPMFRTGVGGELTSPGRQHHYR